MAEQLGRLQKPLVDRFRGGRNLLLVPLVYGPLEEEEGKKKLETYWSQMQDQVMGFESRLGQIKHIYHELVAQSGEDGLKRLEVIDKRSHEFVKARCDAGAMLEAAEDDRVLREVSDLQHCLLLPLTSETVSRRLMDWFLESSQQRNEHIAKRIDETLGSDEVGILFISEGHQVQFPTGVEVFYVAPPGLDELHRWFRDQHEKHREKAAESETGESPV